MAEIDAHQIHQIFQLRAIRIMELSAPFGASVAVLIGHQGGGIRAQVHKSHIHTPHNSDLRVAFPQGIQFLTGKAAVTENHPFQIGKIWEIPFHFLRRGDSDSR